MSGHIASAARENWNTPPIIVEAVRLMLGGSVDLDPCSNPASQVGAKRRYSREDGQDGLSMPWDAPTIYVNPPFGKGIAKWVGRCVQAARDGSRVVLLVPAAVDTRHWHDMIFRHAAEICFLRGRVEFVGAKASAPFATALVYFGASGADTFRRYGWRLGFCVGLEGGGIYARPEDFRSLWEPDGSGGLREIEPE
jgi:site-specific DNA-methyltransferase (adenine-specific)